MQAQGLPSQLGVRPTGADEPAADAVVRLDVRRGPHHRGVAVPVVGSQSFLRTAYEYWLMITLATFALGIGVQVAIPKVSALVGLMLFFVRARLRSASRSASCRRCTPSSRSSRRSSARRRCSAGRRSTGQQPSATSTRSAASCSWA